MKILKTMGITLFGIYVAVVLLAGLLFFGYHIIKLTDKKNPEVQPFDSVKDMVRRELERGKKKELLDKMMSDVKGSAKMVINEKVLDEEIKRDAKEKSGAHSRVARDSSSPAG